MVAFFIVPFSLPRSYLVICSLFFVYVDSRREISSLVFFNMVEFLFCCFFPCSLLLFFAVSQHLSPPKERERPKKEGLNKRNDEENSPSERKRFQRCRRLMINVSKHPKRDEVKKQTEEHFPKKAEKP